MKLNNQQSYIYLCRLNNEDIKPLISSDIEVSDDYKEIFIKIRKEINKSELNKMTSIEYLKKIDSIIPPTHVEKYNSLDMENLIKLIKKNKIKL